MSPDLTAEFQHLDTRTDAMVDRVRAYPPEVQNKPVDKSYSPLKAVEHMYLVERMYVDQIDKFDKAKYAGKVGKPWFTYHFVLKNMAKPANTASPTIKAFSPDGTMTLDESAANWREQRAKLITLLGDFDDNQAAIKHPFFGFLSPRDLFILLEKHTDYHEARLPK
jgi:hypothetical protein